MLDRLSSGSKRTGLAITDRQIEDMQNRLTDIDYVQVFFMKIHMM